MIKNRSIFILAAVMIAMLSIVIINGCGDDAATPVIPTATPTTQPVTPTSTISPTATNTPTPVPTVKDVSDQFNISADYYIAPDPQTGVNAGTLIIQLYQKSNTNNDVFTLIISISKRLGLNIRLNPSKKQKRPCGPFPSFTILTTSRLLVFDAVQDSVDKTHRGWLAVSFGNLQGLIDGHHRL